MIFPAFKESLLKDLGTIGIVMIDGDRWKPSEKDETIGDLPAGAVLGEPQPLQNASFDYGVLRADPVEFEPIQGKTPDYMIVFLGDGRLVCVIDQLDWSERKTDGRKLRVDWPATGIFQL